MDLEQFRPMLAASLPCVEKRVPTDEEVLVDLKRLDWTYGIYATPKVDGIRGVKGPNALVSRTLIPIPNQFTQQYFKAPELLGIDGELIVGTLEDPVDYNTNQSAFMSQGGTPDAKWCVFDWATAEGHYHDRQQALKAHIESLGHPNVIYLQYEVLKDPEAVLRYEQWCLAAGFEGCILRHPGCRYKNNRSTFREQGMIKMKRFTDAEAIIKGFEELYINTNEPTKDNRGFQTRSSHLAGMVGADTLGKLLCEVVTGEFTGADVAIGSGLDDALRALVWANRPKYLGKIVKFKYQSHGSKDAPRSPIFLGFRDPIDFTPNLV
jgi:DNA ligase-1